MDDFDNIPAPEPEMSRVYSWDGKEIQPFSYGRQTAFQRCGVVGGSGMEAAVVLVKLCTMSAKDVSAIRGDAVEPFLRACEEWAELNGIGLGTGRKAKTEAIVKIYNDILNDLYEAEKIAPESPDTAPAPGNA